MITDICFVQIVIQVNIVVNLLYDVFLSVLKFFIAALRATEARDGPYIHISVAFRDTEQSKAL